MFKPRVGLATVAHPLEVGFDRAPALLEQAAQALAATSCAAVVHRPVIADIQQAQAAADFLAAERLDGLVVLTATWCDDFLSVRLVERLGVPVLTWAVRGVETGSLCGTQQLALVLAELGRAYRFLLGDPDDSATRRVLGDFAAVVGLRSYLRNLRIGLLGHRTFGMTEIAVDELELRRRLGPEVVPLALRRFVERVERIPEPEAARIWRDAAARAAAVTCTPPAGLYAAQVYLALQELVREQLLGAIAVDCYPDYLGRFCLAAALLAEQEVIVACEGDVNGAAAQAMMHFLTGGPTHNTDLLDVDPAGRTALFSHCGNGHFSLAATPGEIALAPVRLSNQGVCLRFTGRPGPVTALNLVGRAGSYRMGVIEAEAVPTELVFPGNPTKLALPIGGRDFLDFVAEKALGHHWLIGYGHVAERLRLWAAFNGGIATYTIPFPSEDKRRNF